MAWMVCPSYAFADNVQYSGSLVAVTKHSVWVRQANGVVTFARLPDTGDLSAQALIRKYRFGQKVSAKTSTIDGFWDNEDGQYYLLELQALRPLGRPRTRKY